MGKGTNTVTQNSAPPAQVLANYQDVYNRAQAAASTPYQPYQGQIVPNLNQDQLTAFQAMGMGNMVSSPYYNQAAQYLNQSASPLNISNANTSQYVSPYAQAGASNAQAAGQGIANYGTTAGQNIANYGNNAGNNIANYASGIGAAGPQLQQFSAQNLQQYLNPYTQNVIDATGANIDRSNAVQSNSLTGSAIQAGNAFGGDRAGVAQAELARNQALAKNQTMAQLESQGYSQALGQFNTSNQQALAGQQTALGGIGQGAALGLGAQTSGAQLGLSGQQAGAQLGLSGAQLGTSATQNAQQLALSQQNAQNQFAANAGNSMAGLGNTAQNSWLQGAGAQLQAGTLQQQQNAAQLNVPYQQYLQGQQYPFQTTGWLSNIAQGIGSGSGGTSSTTSPAPSAVSQIGGLGLAGLGAYNSGAFGALGGAFNSATTAAASGMSAAELAAMTGEGVDTAAAAMAMLPFGAKGGGRIGYDDGGSVDDTDGLGSLVGYNTFHNDTSEARAANTAALHEMGYASGGLTLPTVQPDFSDKPMPFANSGLAGVIPNLTPMKSGRGIGIPAAPSPYHNNDVSNLTQQINQVSSAFKGGHAYGGVVGHYADGGMPDDPFGDDNRAAAYELLKKGLGSVAPDAIPGGEPVPEPIRMPSEEATDAWRKGVDRDVASGVTAPDSGTALPPEIASGSSRGLAPDDSPAMAYAGQPQQGGIAGAPPPNPNGQALLDQAMAAAAPKPVDKPNPWMSVMQAGLAMAASRNPQALGAIGEGGLAGLKNFQEQQKDYNDLDTHPIIDHNGPTIRIYYPSTKQWIDTGIPTMTAADKSRRDDEKEQRKLTNDSAALIRGPDGKMVVNPAYLELKKELEKEKITPGVIDTDPDTGAEIRGFIDATNKKYFDANGNPYTPRGIGTNTAPKVSTKDAGTVGVNTAESSGAYDYRKNAPAIEKGMDVPEPVLVAGKSAQTIKTDAENYLQTGKLPTIAARGKSGPAVVQQQYRTAVENYGNAVAASRGLKPEEVVEMHRSAPYAYKFIMGPDGRSTVSLGTAVRHLDTLKEYIDAAKFPDTPRFRQVQAMISREFGETAATNIDAAAKIVGPEIIKAIGVAGAGTESDRNEATNMFRGGTKQAVSAIQVVEHLLAGQLEGKKKQAANLGVSEQRFKSLIGDRPYEILTNIDKGAGSKTSTTPTKPSLQEFLAKAKEANPGATDAQLTEFYNKKYGS